MQRRHLNCHCRREHGKSSPAPAASCTGHFEVELNATECAECPVQGCPAEFTGRYGVRRHFNYRHPEADVKVVGDGPTERCNACGLFVPFKDGTIPMRHRNSKYCRDGTRRVNSRDFAEQQILAEQQKFNVRRGLKLNEYTISNI